MIYRSHPLVFCDFHGVWCFLMFIVLWLYTGISMLQRPSLVGTCGTASWVWENNLRWVDCPVWKIPRVHSLVGFYINIFLLCDTPQCALSPITAVMSDWSPNCFNWFVDLPPRCFCGRSLDILVHLICFVDLPICCFILNGSQFWWDYSYISYLSPLFSFENLQVDRL